MNKSFMNEFIVINVYYMNELDSIMSLGKAWLAAGGAQPE